MNPNVYLKSINEFKEEYENHESILKESSEISDILLETKKYLKSVRDYIYHYFSENGSAKDIREMYESVVDGTNRSKTLEIFDMNRSHKLYENYNDGMKKYINEVISMESFTEDSDTIKTIQKAHGNDSLFIKSLFGGYNNAKEETNICEAVKNIECLIDFIPYMESLSNSIDDYLDKMRGKESNSVLLESMKLYTDSLSYYCFETVSGIVSDYNQIQLSIHSDESENDSFILF